MTVLERKSWLRWFNSIALSGYPMSSARHEDLDEVLPTVGSIWASEAWRQVETNAR